MFKNFYPVLIVCIASGLIFRCVSEGGGSTNTQPPPPKEDRIYKVKWRNDVVKKPELTKLVKSKKNLKIALRVPQKFNETEDLQEILKKLEKEFFKKGYSLRDRILMDKISENSNQNDNYHALGQKMDTDLILEIINYSEERNSFYQYSAKKDGTDEKEEKKARCNCDVLEYKVIIVKQGEVGGIFKIFSTGYFGCNDRKVVDEDNFVYHIIRYLEEDVGDKVLNAESEKDGLLFY